MLEKYRTNKINSKKYVLPRVTQNMHSVSKIHCSSKYVMRIKES